MIKLAYGGGKVFVSLTSQEFRGLAGEPHSGVADGTDISLLPIKQKLDLVDAKEAELKVLKQAAADVVDKLTAIGM